MMSDKDTSTATTSGVAAPLPATTTGAGAGPMSDPAAYNNREYNLQPDTRQDIIAEQKAAGTRPKGITGRMKRMLGITPKEKKHRHHQHQIAPAGVPVGAAGTSSAVTDTAATPGYGATAGSVATASAPGSVSGSADPDSSSSSSSSSSDGDVSDREVDLAAVEAEKIGVAPAASVGAAAADMERSSVQSTDRSVVGSVDDTATSTATAGSIHQPALRELAPAALLAATAATGAHAYPNMIATAAEGTVRHADLIEKREETTVFEPVRHVEKAEMRGNTPMVAAENVAHAALVEKREETTVFEPVRHTEKAEITGAAPMVAAEDVKHAPLVERREIKTLFQPVKQAEKHWVYVADELLQVGVRPMSQLSGTTAAEVLAGTAGYEGRRLREVNTAGGIRGALQSLMGGSHNSEGVITAEGGVFTENYSERRVTGPAVIVTVREEIVVYEAVLHEEKAIMEGGHRLNQPARTSLQPISAVAEVPVYTGNASSGYDAAIAPVATDAITQHNGGLNATAAFRSGGPISSLLGGSAATTSTAHHGHTSGGGITGAVKNLLGGNNKQPHQHSNLQDQYGAGTTNTALGASQPPATGYTDTAIPAAATSVPTNNNASGITDSDINTPLHGRDNYNESGIRDADINTRTNPAAEFKPSNNSGYNDSDINTPLHVVDQSGRAGPVSRMVGKMADNVHARQ